MPWARLVSTIGKAMMISGLVLIGFAGYELWGTGLHTQRAQDDLEQAYFARLAELRSSVDDAPVTTAPAGEQAPLDPFLDPEVLARLQELPPPEGGDPIGKIEIPAIKLDWWIVEGTDLSYLRDGPGHFSNTPMPGQPGNAGLAGHRTTYGAPFQNLDRLEIGDEIIVSTFQGKFVYEVMPIPIVGGEAQWRPVAPPPSPEDGGDGNDDGGGDEASDGAAPDATTAVATFDEAEIEGYAAHFIVTPDAGEIVANYGDDRLTLMACHPKYSARQRIVVSAKLIGPAAPPLTPTVTPGDDDEPLPTEDGPGLLEGGDPSQRVPMLLWGLVAALVAIAAAEGGKRFRRARWPIYALAVPPFLGAMWIFYGHLDALLPAAL